MISGGINTYTGGTQNYAWTIASASGGIIGFDPLKFNLDASAFQNALGGGSFSISQSGNDVNVSFSAVPEPEEYAVVHRPMHLRVEQAFQPAGSGGFPAARIDCGLESPPNPQTGKSALQNTEGKADAGRNRHGLVKENSSPLS